MFFVDVIEFTEKAVALILNSLWISENLMPGFDP